MNGIDARVIKHLPPVRESPAFELKVHLQVGSGICVLIGASGAGKTLLLDCIGGFLRPDEGRILVDDDLYYDAATGIHLPPERRRCGYIFQDHALFPHMTVRGNLDFAASLAQRKAGLHRHRSVNEYLTMFDLGELGGRKPDELSGGQKQRAALARILITEPRILLLDEPSRALDVRLQRAFWELLRSVREKLTAPILLVSHDADECFELADSVAVIERGRLLQSGTRSEVFSKPATMEVARLLGIYEIAPAEIQALDPGANSSIIRVFGQQLETAYLPGHLIGDQGFLCVQRSEVSLLAPQPQLVKGGSPAKDQLSLAVRGWRESTRGVRIQFENDFSVEVSRSEFEQHKHHQRLILQIPQSAVAFTQR